MRKFMAAITTVLFIFIFTAIAAAKEKEIRVSLQPCLHGLPSWLDVQEGNDKKLGLKFTLQLYPSGAPQNEALAAKQWDVGATGVAPALMAVLRYDAKIIGISNNESETNDLWVRPDSPLLKTKGANPDYPDIYGTSADWKGKKILVTTISTGHYSLSSTLKALGLADRDVNIVNIEQAQGVTAFGVGEGDIISLWAPFSYIAESKGWVKVSSGRAAKVVVPGAIIARKDFALKSPELTVAWLGSYQQKIDFMRTQPKEAEVQLDKFFRDYCGMELPRELLKYEFQLRPLFSIDQQIAAMEDPQQFAAWLEGIANFFLEQGTLKKKDIETLKKKNFGIDSSFMKQVKAQAQAGQ